MATILALKRRIKAAQNVSKTTKAMQMIAASKLKRAQEATLATRPYVEKLTTISKNIINKINSDVYYPYLKSKNKINKTLLIIISPDKGLCGGMITNLLREFLKIKDQDKNIVYLTIGKKAENKIARMTSSIAASFPLGNTTPAMDVVFPIIRIIDDYYLNGKVDTVKILTTHFTSIFSQIAKISTILPVHIPQDSEEKSSSSSSLFEPSENYILDPLLKHYLEMAVFQLILESFVSEQASRMIAMQNATDNANDVIEDLKLEYNKTRQAKITSEILDISSSVINTIYE